MPRNRNRQPKENLLGGLVVSIPAYYEGQNAEGEPDHFVTSEEATLLKSQGRARPIHRGKALLIRGPRVARRFHRFEKKSRWAVVGQTNRNSGPGFPHYSSV
jgi:hypothetical protein